MSRWIDADAFKSWIDEYVSVFKKSDKAEIKGYISHQPSIEIVRCGECKYWKSTVQMPNGTEVKCLYGRKADDFCSYGSRSEKPNNSTISKMEQVETMSCAECKHRPIGAEICEEPCHYEPQTDWHYDEQDATWYPYKHEDEPQQKSCATCKHALGNWDGESNNCGRRCGADHRFYEPKDEPKTEGVENDTNADIYTKRFIE